ncbi:MAG TPA: phosphatase PAP2 family protein [Polyangiaceae bacterium]|nr:phosphatase PAP2 family protein [Polyangiaceae bacterium]
MSKFRKSRHADQGMRAVGALALLSLMAGCERTQPDAAEQEQEQEQEQPSDAPAEADGKLVLHWNTIASEVALAADAKYEDPFLHLRALTMMHLAMHDAANGAFAKYERFALRTTDERAEPAAAAAAAAHAVLRSLYPRQGDLIDERLSEVLANTPIGAAHDRGVALGKGAAEAVLSQRSTDRADATEPYTPRDEPGKHRFVPPFELVYRPAWRNVEPFALDSGDQFRSSPPPALDTTEYATAYEEVRSYGRATDSTRTEEQTFYADFWYELSEIGWNRITRITWAEQSERDLWFTARLFALVNVGLMDAYIAGWDSKMHYDFWRPYSAIRAGATDHNDATPEEADWQPYCVTPPVQDYPSTHSALGAAAAEILHGVYGRDIPFTMESTSTKPAGKQRSVVSFEQAALENADSRVACGIHFRFATQAGLQLGKHIGDHVLDTLLAPRQPSPG